jgi:hypothetical protein
VIEPYLIQQGFLQRTPRGRIATLAAYRHLGVTPPLELGLAHDVHARRAPDIPVLLDTGKGVFGTLHIAADDHRAKLIQAADGDLGEVTLLFVAETGVGRAHVVVHGDVECASRRAFTCGCRHFGGEATGARREVGDLVVRVELGRVQRVGRGARVVVVIADVVGSREIRAREPLAKADAAEAAFQLNPRSAVPEGAGRAADDTGVAVQAVLQREGSLQATTEVFAALEAKARGVVLHNDLAVLRAELLAFDRGVDAAPEGHALGERRSGGNSGGESGDKCNLLHRFAFTEGLGEGSGPCLEGQVAASIGAAFATPDMSDVRMQH